MNATASEVFGVCQYSNITLTALHESLKRNKDSRRFGTWEYDRIEAVRDEMQRRGIKSKGARP